jgi:hypothetical protein
MQHRPLSATTDRPVSIALDPADIYRRLDRKPAPRPLWMTAVAIAVLAVVAAGGVIAFQDELKPLASHTQALTPGSVIRS